MHVSPSFPPRILHSGWGYVKSNSNATGYACGGRSTSVHVNSLPEEMGVLGSQSDCSHTSEGPGFCSSGGLHFLL